MCALCATGPAICPLSCGFARCRGCRFICDAHNPSARRWFRCRWVPSMCTNIVVAYAIRVTILQFGTGRRISTVRPSRGVSRRFCLSRDIINSIVVCVLCLSLYSGNVPSMEALAALCTVFTSIPGCRRPLAVRPPRGPISPVRRVSASAYPRYWPLSLPISIVSTIAVHAPTRHDSRVQSRTSLYAPTHL